MTSLTTLTLKKKGISMEADDEEGMDDMGADEAAVMTSKANS